MTRTVPIGSVKQHGSRVKLSVATEVRSGGLNQDRAAAFLTNERAVLVIADGAGGTGSGAKAAEIVLQQARALVQGGLPVRALLSADQQLVTLGALSTAIVVVASGDVIHGASCGDSSCWLIGSDGVVELTEHQNRRPLVGNGCRPSEFRARPGSSRLLIATDGLSKYARLEQILAAAQRPSLVDAAHELAELPRLPCDAYQDDVGIVLAAFG